MILYAPLLWIILPVAVSALLLFLLRWRLVVHWSAAAFALLLALAAAWLPSGAPLNLGPLSLEVMDALGFFGRRLELVAADRPALVIIYAGLAFWLAGAVAAGVPARFSATALGLGALLTATLAVEPFLYAALIIEISVLAALPLLSPPGEAVGRGALRWLTFATLGMPLLLFTGWMLTSNESGLGLLELQGRALLLLATGFALLLAIFPLHSWVPMVMSEAHPYAAGFVLYTFSLAVLLFGATFFERYIWISQNPGTYAALRFAGVLMVAAGGLLAMFQRHLGRILGFALLTEIGYALLAASLASVAGWGWFFFLILPRWVGLGVWSLGLAVLFQNFIDLRFRSIAGAARYFPLAALALVIAHFSSLGFPLTAGFPARFEIWLALADQPLWVGAGLLLGSAGLLVAGLRSLAVLVMGAETSAQEVREYPLQRLLIILGLLALVGIGLLPQIFLNPLQAAARLFLGL